MQTVSSCEAKKHFSALLDLVAKGEKITITRHGVPVAMLVPRGSEKSDVRAAIQNLIESRKGNRLDGISIRELIDEGRR